MAKSYPWEFRAFETLWRDVVEIVVILFHMVSVASRIVLIPFNLDGIIPPIIKSITERIKEAGNAIAVYVHHLDLLYVYILEGLPCGKPPVYK